MARQSVGSAVDVAVGCGVGSTVGTDVANVAEAAAGVGDACSASAASDFAATATSLTGVPSAGVSFLGRRFIGFLNGSHGRERWGLDDLFGDCHRFFDHDSFDYFFSSGYLLLNRFLDHYGLDNLQSTFYSLDDLFSAGHLFFDHDGFDDFFNSGYLLLDYYGFDDPFNGRSLVSLRLRLSTTVTVLDGLALYHTFRVSKLRMMPTLIRSCLIRFA